MIGSAVEPVRAEQSTATVERLHGALLDVMQHADSMDYAARRAKLAPVIEQGFDAGFMVRAAAGSYWKGMAETEKAALTANFRDFTLANYAARFNGYSGQKFETMAQTPMPAGRELVKTRLVRGKADPVALDYVLRQTPEGWAIIDIFMDGKISELATRRSEFAPILRDHGASGLIAALADKTAAIAAEADGK